jgi:hypothetical protein
MRRGERAFEQSVEGQRRACVTRLETQQVRERAGGAQAVGDPQRRDELAGADQIVGRLAAVAGQEDSAAGDREEIAEARADVFVLAGRADAEGDLCRAEFDFPAGCELDRAPGFPAAERRGAQRCGVAAERIGFDVGAGAASPSSSARSESKPDMRSVWTMKSEARTIRKEPRTAATSRWVCSSERMPAELRYSRPLASSRRSWWPSRTARRVASRKCSAQAASSRPSATISSRSGKAVVVSFMTGVGRL